MTRACRSLAFILCVVCLTHLPLTVFASQVQGHLYAASRMIDEIPEMRSFANIGPLVHAVMLGSVAPDAHWIAYAMTYKELRDGEFKDMPIPEAIAELPPATDAHMNQPTEVCLALLKAAETRGELAYALGWITHYITDTYIHDLINQWGGYFYSGGVNRHKALEALECKHVIAQHADKMHLTRFEPGHVDSRMFAGLVTRAFATVYPDNSNYQEPGAATFVEALLLGDEMVAFGSQWFYEYATNPPTDALKSLALQTMHDKGQERGALFLAAIPKLPVPPRQDEYEGVFMPLHTTVLASDTSLEITLRMPDSRMHARFLHEWERAMDEAVRTAAHILPLCVAYGQKQIAHWRNIPRDDRDYAAPLPPDLEEERSRIRAALAAINPLDDLDKPREYADRQLELLQVGPTWFPQPTFLPTHVYIDLEVTGGATISKSGKEVAVEVSDEARDAAYKAGQQLRVTVEPAAATFRVPTPATPYEYSGRFMLRPDPLAEGIDWIGFSGKYPPGELATTGDGVPLGNPFDVTITLPEGEPDGDPRWVFIRRDDDVTEHDLDSIRLSMDTERFRFDIHTLEQTRVGDEVRATLQFTNLNLVPFTGPGKLVMVWFPEGKGHTDLAGLMAELREVMETAEAALDAMDTIMERLDEDDLAALEKTMEAYEQELARTNLTEEQQEEMFEKKLAEELGKLGIDLEAELAADPAVAAVTAERKVPFFSTRSLEITPVEAVLRLPEGWEDTTRRRGELPSAAGRSRGEERGQVMVGGEPREVVLVRWEAEISVHFFDNVEFEDALRGRLADVTGAITDLKIGIFEGRMGERERTLAAQQQQLEGAAVLHFGKVVMAIAYDVKTTGSSDEHMAGKRAELRSDILGMIERLQVAPMEWRRPETFRLPRQ